MEKHEHDELIEKLKLSPSIGHSIDNIFVRPSTTRLCDRGVSMFMLSDDNLSEFEWDLTFKNYSGFNHKFADLLVPLNDRNKNPIIFWLANKNPPGCNYILETEPIIHHVLQLGNPYSLEEVVRDLCKALKYEEIKTVAPWFLRDVEQAIGPEAYHPIPECKGVILEK